MPNMFQREPLKHWLRLVLQCSMAASALSWHLYYSVEVIHISSLHFSR